MAAAVKAIFFKVLTLCVFVGSLWHLGEYRLPHQKCWYFSWNVSLAPLPSSQKMKYGCLQTLAQPSNIHSGRMQMATVWAN